MEFVIYSTADPTRHKIILGIFFFDIQSYDSRKKLERIYSIWGKGLTEVKFDI